MRAMPVASTDGPEARHILPLGVPTGDAAGEQFVKQGVAHAFGGRDDRLCALNGIVDGVQHGGYGPLLGQGRETNLDLPVSRVSELTPVSAFERVSSIDEAWGEYLC